MSLQNPVRLRVVEPEHAGLKFLPVEHGYRVAFQRNDADAELAEAITQKSIACRVNMDAGGPGRDFPGNGCD